MGFHTFDFVLNDHNYITLLYMHINFYFQFQWTMWFLEHLPGDGKFHYKKWNISS